MAAVKVMLVFDSTPAAGSIDTFDPSTRRSFAAYWLANHILPSSTASGSPAPQGHPSRIAQFDPIQPGSSLPSKGGSIDASSVASLAACCCFVSHPSSIGEISLPARCSLMSWTISSGGKSSRPSSDEGSTFDWHSSMRSMGILTSFTLAKKVSWECLTSARLVHKLRS